MPNIIKIHSEFSKIKDAEGQMEGHNTQLPL